MKMIVDSSDIYDIQIDDVNLGRNSLGCPEGYSDFEADVDEVTQDDNNIVISISGTCENFGYHDPISCTFEGTLTMNESDFTYEYTNAAEDGSKYIMFDGNIEITIKLGDDEDDEDEDDDYYDDYITEKHEITAKVYFSDLDP